MEKFNKSLTFLIMILTISGCGLMVKGRVDTTVYKPQEAYPKVNYSDSSTVFLGIGLNEKFNSIPECKYKFEELGPYQGKITYSVSYIREQKDLCYETSLPNYGKELIFEDIYKGKKSVWLREGQRTKYYPDYIVGIKIELINGIVGKIEAITLGDNYQAKVKTKLTEKFGKPSYSKVEMVQNKMGAKYESNVVDWYLKNGNTVRMYGIYEKLDVGKIIIKTPEYSNYELKKSEEYESNQPKI